MTEKPDEFKVAVVVSGFECAPAEITKLFGIEPTRTWLKGDVIYPKVKVRRKQNAWMLRSNMPNDTPFVTQLQSLLDAIMPKKELFSKLPPNSGVEISCVAYTTHGRPDISLPADMIKAIAEIGAELNFDLYQLPSDDEEKAPKAATSA
jgi:Domain of unknown function (DUF4279)